MAKTSAHLRINDTLNRNASFVSVRKGSACLGLRAPPVTRSGRLAKLTVCNVAEFTRASAPDTILCAKFNAHTAAVASVVIVEDSGECSILLGNAFFVSFFVKLIAVTVSYLNCRPKKTDCNI